MITQKILVKLLLLYMLCRKEDGVLRVMEIDQVKNRLIFNYFLKYFIYCHTWIGAPLLLGLPLRTASRLLLLALQYIV